MRFEISEAIVNEGEDVLVLIVEPWASEFSIAPGATFVVRAKSEVQGTLEVEREPARVTCWAWPHSTVEVWSGDRLIDSLDRPVPAVPEGSSVRRFLRGMFGHGDTP
jgi:hypothetical protein